MKINRLLKLTPTVLVCLGLIVAQAMAPALGMLGQAMPTNSISVSDSPCDCCPDCSDLAASGKCSLLCVHHPGYVDISLSPVAAETGSPALPWVYPWTHLTVSPDLHPPSVLRLV